MTNKRLVRITVESLHDGRRTIHRADGEWYVRPDGHALRYPEDEAAMGKTMTLLRWMGDEVRITRQGDVLSELVFRQGGEGKGRYRLPQGFVPVRTYTGTLQSEWTDQTGIIRLAYRLRMADQEAGRFELVIRVQCV